jgi:tRNA-splicing ligase RtcB
LAVKAFFTKILYKMSSHTWRGKDLVNLGFPQNPSIGLSIQIIYKHYKRSTKQEITQVLVSVLAEPEKYYNDAIWGKIAEILKPSIVENFQRYDLVSKKDFSIYGREGIDEGAIRQMEIAMSLPITVAGSLMPDAHQGYGLPIGGVLATQNVVIPYGVGMDIGCRMCLSILPIEADYLDKNRSSLKKILAENTRFGRTVFPAHKDKDDLLFDHKTFDEISFIRNLKGKAMEQIGSSGSGNHFVEFGILEITNFDDYLGVPIGKYLAILSHSGSRGFGASIAGHYTKIAIDKCRLPQEAKNLAWLSLEEEAGIEYWLGMSLAGDFASACHHHIHRRITKALGESPLKMIENHHNFAWKETLPDGKEVIVHRKGATPAGKGVLGIIPGSMSTAGFIVRGKGNSMGLDSASHGAGRLFSRTKAKQSFTHKELRQTLKKAGVDLIGGGLDEAPFAYKDIHQVMAYQKDLVDVLAHFEPKIVRMDDSGESED